MPIDDSLFKDPHIDRKEIIAQRKQRAVKGEQRGGYGKDPKTVPLVDDVEEEGATAKADPFLNEVLTVLGAIEDKADVVIREGRSAQRLQIRSLSRDLKHCTDAEIGGLNEIVDMEDDKSYSNGRSNTGDPDDPNPTEIRDCDLECVAKLAGYEGDPQPDKLKDKLNALEDAEDTAKMIEIALEESMDSMSGWEMFIFMCRFILAYTVHMILGFLCCFFLGKLKLEVPITGPVIIDLGKVLSEDFFGKAERWLKKALGFPCAEGTDPDCFEPGGMLKPETFSPFPCCPKSCDGENVTDVTRKDKLKECLKAFIRHKHETALGIGDGSQPCRNCATEPTNVNYKNIEWAKAFMKSQISWSAWLESDGKNIDNKAGTNSSMTDPIKHAINIGEHSKQIAGEMSGALMEHWKYKQDENSEDCAMVMEGGLGQMLGKGIDNLTKEDLTQAMLANMDTNFSDLLGAGNQGSKTFDGKTPPDVEPFKTIFETVKIMDDTLTGILAEARKIVVGAKVLTNVATSREFCCIIWTIAFLGNLIKYHKLCPRVGIEELFKYAQDWGDNKDIQKAIGNLELLRDIIKALNAEILGELSLIGISLPLGSLVELLKRIVSNSVIALLSMAVAPMDKVLTEIAAAPNLKEMLNNNCFGIGDLFGMFRCGFKWIFDMIKEWISGLITMKARNMELLSDIRIANFKMSFLLQLQYLLDDLINLLLGIGDCYSPENMVKDIIDHADKKTEEMKTALVDVLAEGAKEYNDIGTLKTAVPKTLANRERKRKGEEGGEETEVFPDMIDEVIDEMGDISEGTALNSFPILKQDAARFIDAVRKNSRIDITKIGEYDQDSVFVFNAEILEELAGGITREDVKENLLNMVKIISNMK